MIVKALKKDGRLNAFDPSDRDGEGGVFLLLHREGVFTLIIDETSLEDHGGLFSRLSDDLRIQEIYGGGEISSKCNQNLFPYPKVEFVLV